MPVYRTFDPTLLNQIANKPDIKKTIGAHLVDQILDFSDHASRPDDFVILTNGIDAFSLYEYRGPCVLDGHSIFDETCRGRDAMRIGREMIDWVFHNTSALILTGATPTGFRAARFFNRKLGMTSAGIKMFDGALWKVEMEYFQLLRSDWSQYSSNMSG